ncbi:MAG: hypothetical protein CFK52_00200 [Chloracidobacterium sp. CP2_5A]|nr:MAG: hypothetical protein CFK52_00200 [Chloracidobacterium sp. CP2_5A]
MTTASTVLRVARGPKAADRLGLGDSAAFGFAAVSPAELGADNFERVLARVAGSALGRAGGADSEARPFDLVAATVVRGEEAGDGNEAGSWELDAILRDDLEPETDRDIRQTSHNLKLSIAELW